MVGVCPPVSVCSASIDQHQIQTQAARASKRLPNASGFPDSLTVRCNGSIHGEPAPKGNLAGPTTFRNLLASSYSSKGKHKDTALPAMKRCFRCENMSCLMYLSSSGARLTGWYLPGTAAAASTAAVDAPFL